jgi:dihydropteroate synthase
VGVLRLGHRAFGPEQLLVMTVVSAADPGAAMERVHAAAAEGADAVEIGGVGPAGSRADPRIVPLIAAVRETHPELVIGVSTGRAEVARAACAAGAGLLSGSGSGLAGVAAEFGAGVVCLPGSAGHAIAAGVAPERIVVGLEPVRELEELVATGWPVLVSPSDREPTASLATAAVAAWLGARVFRVDQVLQTRRALRMVSAIRGDTPPVRTVRGLALFLVTRPESAAVGALPVANHVKQRRLRGLVPSDLLRVRARPAWCLAGLTGRARSGRCGSGLVR